jgi:hypothetical protein
MSMWRSRGLWLGSAIASATAVVAATCIGCEATPRRRPSGPPPTPVVRLTHHVGGTHYRVIRHENVLYQAFGPTLLVAEPRSHRIIERINIGEIGMTGAVVDLIVHDEMLYAVLDREAVVEFALGEPSLPRILVRESAASLGILPQRLSIAGGSLYVSGIGGVVRWDDGRVVLTADDIDHDREVSFSRVAMSDQGPVVCVGRRIYRLEDGRYAGSASDLVSAENLNGAPEGALIFIRQHDAGALVGLMTPGLREIDVERTTVAVAGTVRATRIFDDSLWIVSDNEIRRYQIMGDQLLSISEIDILGARDIDRADENHLVIVGSFGRSYYRVRATHRGPAEVFTYTQREPAGLMHGRSDGRHVLGGGPTGNWLYLIGSRVELTDMSFDAVESPPTSAVAVDARAVIEDDGRQLTVTADRRTFTVTMLDGRRLHTVIAVEGEFWIGHDDGVAVFSVPPAPTGVMAPRPLVLSNSQFGAFTANLPLEGEARIDGPVRYLFPLRNDQGVAYVARDGGMGVVRYTIDDAAR